ncbi:MAG: hypothetical protein SPL42_01155 [Bacteroidales bacterium]|nr:hypothetical protein [Bacteroidales bacterium]
MYLLNWDIAIGAYKVKTLTEVKITTSVLNLSDTATITMPGQYLNTWRKIEDKVHVGDAVTIKLGYDNNLETEFTGYLKRISRDNNALVLECEDALWLTNRAVADMEYKSISLKELLTAVLAQVDPEMTVECDYDFTYEKTVVFKSTALDVLKKVHEDTKANIWFEGKTLHVHPVYQQAKGDKPVIYDTEVNVQSNELKWKDATDRKVMVEVKYVKPNGELSKQEYGVNGGEKVTRYVEASNEEDLKKAAENEYNLWNYSGYEGSLTGWLVPVVKAGGSVRLRDKKRPEEGVYYVTGVEIEFGRNGAKRKVTLGRKLG